MRKLGQGQSLSHWRPGAEGDVGQWVYSCRDCLDTGWRLGSENSPQGVGYKRHVVGHRCDCTARTGSRHERPDVSATWEWMRNDGRLMFRLKGDRTYWVKSSGELDVYDWEAERTTSYPADHALATLYADVYTRRSTRRYISGS
ncbi:hypothetical protein DRQ53_12000 [bacterium]|nr:MAG: hypothetical protein DRQ53_12000 [bacterium]